MWRKFIQNVFCFFETTFSFLWRFSNIFQFFSKFYSGFSNLYVFANFLPSFLKTIPKYFCIPKFYKKIWNTKFSAIFSTFFVKFFFISDYKLKLPYNVCKVPSRKLKVFQNFIKIFQQPYQLISKCLSNLSGDLSNPGISWKKIFKYREKRKLSFLKISRNVNFKMP